MAYWWLTIWVPLVFFLATICPDPWPPAHKKNRPGKNPGLLQGHNEILCWFAHFLRTCLYKVVKTAVQLAFPPFSTNAYYGNGLASHTVKNLVNMRVLGFLNQFGRFTPFLFSCLFCALFAHFLQNQQGQFCALFKILESRAPSGFATFFCAKF